MSNFTHFVGQHPTTDRPESGFADYLSSERYASALSTANPDAEIVVYSSKRTILAKFRNGRKVLTTN